MLWPVSAPMQESSLSCPAKIDEILDGSVGAEEYLRISLLSLASSLAAMMLSSMSLRLSPIVPLERLTRYRLRQGQCMHSPDGAPDALTYEDPG